MMYKQLIIARRDLNMSPGKLAAQVSHASMAFLLAQINANAHRATPCRYAAYNLKHGLSAIRGYKRGDLHLWALQAAERGEEYFYAKPVNPDEPFGKLVLCEPSSFYISQLTFDKDLYDNWINESVTKVVCGARNMNRLQKAINKAIELGMKEGEDFFIIRDACRTELDPEEEIDGHGVTITCVGFKPMSAEIIDQIGKEYNLY